MWRGLEQRFLLGSRKARKFKFSEDPSALHVNIKGFLLPLLLAAIFKLKIQTGSRIKHTKRCFVEYRSKTYLFAIVS